MPDLSILLKLQLQHSSLPIRRPDTATHKSGGPTQQSTNQGIDWHSFPPISREAGAGVWLVLTSCRFHKILLILLNFYTKILPILYIYKIYFCYFFLLSTLISFSSPKYTIYKEPCTPLVEELWSATPNSRLLLLCLTTTTTTTTTSTTCTITPNCYY